MWQICRSEYIYKSRWLTVRKDAVRTDKGIDIDDFYVLEYPTWVNVIAITQEGKFIIEQQYRHGIQQQVFELCAGVCETNEKPIDAAKRELFEETGIESDELIEIGLVLHYSHKTYYVDYLCITDADKNSIVLQDGETSAFKWVTAKELRSMSRNELATMRQLNFIEELT